MIINDLVAALSGSNYLRFYLPFVKGEKSAGTPRSKEKGPNSHMDIHDAFPLPVDLAKPVCASRRDPAT